MYSLPMPPCRKNVPARVEALEKYGKCENRARFSYSYPAEQVSLAGFLHSG